MSAMSENQNQKTSTMRKERVARQRAAQAPREAHSSIGSALGGVRLITQAVVASLLLAFCQRELVGLLVNGLGLEGFTGDQSLALFSFVTIPFVVTVLHGPRPAVAAGTIASLILWGATHFNPCTLVSSFSGVVLMAALARRVRKVSDLAVFALDVFLLQSVGSLVMVALRNKFAPSLDACEAWQIGALAITSFVAVPVSLMVALPIAERLSGCTSDYTLATYANLENPLFERLSREAPGTYGHSMVVADLAAAAAESIGANPLLARLGGYYHDIGKLSNPRFFMENQSLLGNPHDTLPPSISAMIVASHVKDGSILARDNGLPPPIARIIASHHGTTAMEWFRRKAISQAAEKGEPAAADEWPYRYAGPIPESREETIVSLADTVEAASRSIAAPTRSDLVRLVNGIVASRFADGQLARSALTLSELEEVKRSFVLTLVHRLHVRAAYPDQRK